MRHTHLFLALLTLGLAACVDTRPLALSDDNPASARAASGYVELPTALSDYKTPADFASRATASETASSGEMTGMPGMHHHGMETPGAQHGGAPRGAGAQ
jgi:hypothetical protein